MNLNTQSLQRLLEILKQDGKLAKAEALARICEVVWEWLGNSVRLALASAHHGSLQIFRMLESHTALVTWQPKDSWFEAAGKQHLEDQFYQFWTDYWAEQDYQRWLRDTGRV